MGNMLQNLFRRPVLPFRAALIAMALSGAGAFKAAAASSGEDDYRNQIEPMLVEYCFDCHGDGASKGDLSLDEYASLEAHLQDREKWLAVWKNVRAQLMPPAKKPQPDDGKKRILADWIQQKVFEVDPDDPDPGRVTIRRLNRVEYENTVRDLLGVEFDAEEAFPADDTGYGFDNIGDVLSLSPLLMEKYIAAAEEIVSRAIHTEGAHIPTETVWGSRFKSADPDRDIDPRRAPFEGEAKFVRAEEIAHPGEYEVRVEVRVQGSDDATNHSARFTLYNGDERVASRDLGWDFNKTVVINGKTRLATGRNEFAITLQETQPPAENERSLYLYLYKIDLRGPLDGSYKTYPEKYHRVFAEGAPPDDAKGRQEYARKILRRFADRAFRRPIDDASLDRLAAIARATDAQPNRSFEHGIAQAFSAVLASPRFLFRAEVQPQPDNPGRIVPVDEFALASRLSYFLWSSMPDEELLRLAREKKLRANLRAQIDRMLEDPKARSLIDNFVGQWLLTRNVESIDIDPRRLTGERNLSKALRIFSGSLRRAIRRETEMFVAHLFAENRPAHELLQSDYTFLNEKLAKWYRIGGVKGDEMRLVKLSEDSHRGGILTHASLHVVTSNPTRTSPVKRGLFVMDNLLGLPPVPPPGDVPELEEARKKAKGHASKRELMAIHSEKTICASCHSRFDPMGFALENYDAGGRWREKDGGASIDPAGELITGEKFSDVQELSRILATGNRRRDFYRCLTEKLYTYALGRGVEYYDIGVIDKIVAATEKDGGKIRTIIYEIGESPAFQARRGDGDKFAQE